MQDPRPDQAALASALDALLGRTGLSPRERITILTGAAVALGHEARLARHMAAAVAHAPVADLREVVLQTYLFAGYPRAINGLFALRAAAVDAGHDPDQGLVEGRVAADEATRRGEAICATVYGPNYERLRGNIRSLHPDLDRWMVEEGYGKVLGRPALDLRTRELAAVSALVVLDVPRQVRAHLTGSRQAGATDQDLEEMLTGAALYATADAAARAWELFHRGSRAGDG